MIALRCIAVQVLNCTAMEDEQASEEQAGAALNAALAPLTQLTSLALSEMVTPSGLPALAGLPFLQRACFRDCRGLGSLPAGPWCSSLQLLAAAPDLLVSSGEFLADAGQLQEVLLQDGGNHQHCPALRQWAATHPPLRRLRFVMSGTVPAALLGVVLHLQQDRPELEVTHEPYCSWGRLFEEAFTLPELHECM